MRDFYRKDKDYLSTIEKHFLVELLDTYSFSLLQSD